MINLGADLEFNDFVSLYFGVAKTEEPQELTSRGISFGGTLSYPLLSEDHWSDISFNLSRNKYKQTNSFNSSVININATREFDQAINQITLTQELPKDLSFGLFYSQYKYNDRSFYDTTSPFPNLNVSNSFSGISGFTKKSKGLFFNWFPSDSYSVDFDYSKSLTELTDIRSESYDYSLTFYPLESLSIAMTYTSIHTDENLNFTKLSLTFSF